MALSTERSPLSDVVPKQLMLLANRAPVLKERQEPRLLASKIEHPSPRRTRLKDERLHPNRLEALKDKLEPRLTVSSTESVSERAKVDRRDNALPKQAFWMIERRPWAFALMARERPEPHRAKFLTEIQELNDPKFGTETESPMLAAPRTLRVDPMATADNSERGLLSVTRDAIEALSPILASALRDAEEPSRN